MSIDNTITQETKKDLHTEFREVFISSNIQYYKKLFEEKKEKASSESVAKNYFESVIHGKNKIKCIDEEFHFNEGNIVTSTNLKGIITYANKKFCEVSGYSRSELIGSHHNITRHEYMPSAAFKDLWSTLQSGNEWRGIIKNLRKDGRYYWTYSHIVPVFENKIVVGYTAIRRPALATELTEAIELYKDLQ